MIFDDPTPYITNKKTFLKIKQTFSEKFNSKTETTDFTVTFLGGTLKENKFVNGVKTQEGCTILRRVEIEIMPASILVVGATETDIATGEQSEVVLTFIFPSSYPCDYTDRKPIEALSVFKELMGGIDGFNIAKDIVSTRSISTDDIDFYGVPRNQVIPKFERLLAKCKVLESIRSMKTE